MKVFIAFTFTLALVAVALSGPARQISSEEDEPNVKYLLVEVEEGLYRIEDLVNADNSEIEIRAKASDVSYHYYSRSNPSRGVDIRGNDVSVLANTDFSASRDTIFIVHGWNNNKDSAVNYHIREAILSKHNINVFVVDWSPVAAKTYLSAKNSVVSIGRFAADFVRSLVSRYNVRLDRVACVGHSLGAHVCGGFGSSLNGQLDHIVGLDPAGPLFSVSNTDGRLDRTDARFVQIIHTNGGLLGFEEPIGHSDYFPNGGKSQPGCGLDVAGTCAHSRAYEYYSEAILSNRNLFFARRCTAYSDFTNGRCNSNVLSTMGGYGIDKGLSSPHILLINYTSTERDTTLNTKRKREQWRLVESCLMRYRGFAGRGPTFSSQKQIY